MAEVLTAGLKADITRDFYQDIINNEYYVLVSSVTTDPQDRVNAVNAQYSNIQVLEKALFGKKILPTDVKFMVKYYPWQKGQTYDQYDDREDLSLKRFYSVVGPTNNDTGDYRVYKCLFNNNGSPSETPPNYNEYAEDGITRTADGYVWKYMYAITASEFEAYNASGYVPVTGEFDIDPDPATDGVYGSSISDIFVENPVDNNGYPYVSGVFGAAPGNDGSFVLNAQNLSVIDDYYAGMVIYVTNPYIVSEEAQDSGVSRLYIIDSYTYDAARGFGKVKVQNFPRGETRVGILQPGSNFESGDPNDENVFIAANASFQILPRVRIRGDGQNAVGIPQMIEGSIKSILILDKGEGYTNVVADIVDPQNGDFNPGNVADTDVRATLRPVLTPVGGHGYNILNELYCKHILLYGYITETDNNQIGATNTFSHVGVVKNISFVDDPVETPEVFDNRIAITTDDYEYAEVDQTLVQLDDNNEVTFSARVHEVDASANTVYLSEYMGPYLNLENQDTSFDSEKVLVNSVGQNIQINTPVVDNVTMSPYVQRSGEVYFVEDFVPLTRAESSREEYKLVLEF